jgi:hypothetical protein
METVTLEVGESPRVRFTMVSGDLRLTGREGTTLEAQASERGGLSAKPVGDHIEISCRAACLVFLPAGASIEAEVVGGDVRVAGLRGELKLGTLGGDLSLRRGAKATVERIGGDLAAHRIDGDLAINWVGGDGQVDHVEGAVSIASVGGDLRLRGIAGAVQVTAGGDISLEFCPPPGSSSAARAGGDMLCRLPGQASLVLTLKAGGDLRLAIPGTQERTPEGVTVRMGAAEASAKLTAGGDLVARAEAPVPEGAESGDRTEEAWARVQAQMDATLAEMESNLGSLDARAFGIDAERIRHKVQREVERAQRRVDRERERQARRFGSRPSVSFETGVSSKAKSAVSDDERLAVLRMLEDGSVSVEEAEKLLQALEGER